ncbi:hypothetical protein FOL47_001195 [Perkinsus chesapeaki]|uniref:Uncharacterized protein n=1 Tax=Perkinsus chesapeaki TaxID=330153 RepID=A0A7J6MJN5_PERCH|nr:hypothetical protein FOL47_001195 [Perkinsus chesapeaki]
MVPYRFLLLLLATIYCSTNATSNGEIKKHRLEQLTQEAYEETGGRSAKISLSTEEYRRLLLEDPRPYHAFVLITAPGAVCDVCGPIGEAFDKAAMSHYMAGAVGESDEDEEPVFFVEMNAFHNRDLQRLHGFKSVPHLVHLHEGSKLKYKKSLREYQIASSEIYHQTKLEPPVGEILDWMNIKTGKHVEAYTTKQERVMELTLAFLSMGEN